MTFPARKFAGRDGKERTFSYVRSTTRADASGMSHLRARILAAYQHAALKAEQDAPAAGGNSDPEQSAQ